MHGSRKGTTWSSMRKKRLAAIVEEATVDGYNESEAVVGFFTMIEDYLEVPFAMVVLDVGIKVTGVEPTVTGLPARERGES